MLLRHKETGDLVKITDTTALINPAQSKIEAKIQAGQEEQDPQEMVKTQLIFPSGEDLPKCWIDANYRESRAVNS